MPLPTPPSPASVDAPDGRYRALVVGATGAVGAALVAELLASPRCQEVLTLARRPLALADPGPPGKLRQRVFDLATPETIEREAAAAGPSEGVPLTAFCTLGVGQPRKTTRDEVWRIDVESAAAFARGARAAGARHISLLSSSSADAEARAFYLRLKGAAEAGVAAAGIARTSFFRPSLLVTREIRYGLQDRLTQLLFPIAARVLPARFHQIRVEDLARAMRLNAERPGTPGVEILHYPHFVALLREAPRRDPSPAAE